MTGLEDAVAVVGFAGRFPGADSVHEFWDNLRCGRNSLTWFTEDELPAGAGDVPGHLPVRGVLRGIEDFDAELFGMTPQEAALTDPQQRLMLECARDGLETAGYPPESCPERVGVFLGTGASSYLTRNVLAAGMEARVGEVAARLGSDSTFLATRVAYKLNLRGPVLTVQTACSSSLVAVHLAVQSLLCGEAGLAIAGGVSITVPQRAGQVHTPGGIISADGRLRTFDAGATGTLSGNGGAVVVLKPADLAVAEGDRIHALIRGSAVNNDGAGKVGYTAPAVHGQAEVITLAQRVAGVRPEEISYVEAHGTGTELGDPVEVAALTEAFREGTSRSGFCALGSVKPNIGHLDAAAGVAGLLKAVLALEHELIPATIGFERPNPHIAFDGSPFFVNAEPRPWPRTGGVPRRCGVSSFGIGGTNAHVVLEEAPDPVPATAAPERPVVLPLSAATATALAALARDTAAALSTVSAPTVSVPSASAPLADVAHTLQSGRTEFGHRAAVVADPGDPATDLHARLIGSARQASAVRNVVFLFPGQGTFRPGILGELCERSAVVRSVVEEAAAVLGGGEIAALVRDGSTTGPDWLAQPALLVTAYALSRWLGEGGIVPTAVLGHSLGEYAAACAAGALSFADGVALLARRAVAMRDAPAGAMLAVAASRRRVQPLLEGPLWISGVHGPDSVVVAGEPDAVRGLAARLRAQGIAATEVAVDRAYHTPMIEPALSGLRAAAAGVAWQPLAIPLYGNASGGELTAGTAPGPEHWTEQARSPVRLADAVAAASRLPDPVFLELGTGQVITDVVRRLGGPSGPAVFSLGRTARSGPLRERDLLAAVAGYWTAGGTLDWAAFRAAPGRRVPLPTYPYQRQRHWIDAPPVTGSAMAPPAEAAGPAVSTASTASTVDMESAVSAEPEDEITATVRQIWAELLGHDRFTVTESFLELGGNSLTAVQMLTRLRGHFEVKLSLPSLFENPTVAGIAGLVAQRLARPVLG